MHLPDIIYCADRTRATNARCEQIINYICAHLTHTTLALCEPLVVEHLFFWSACIPTLQEKPKCLTNHWSER